MGELYHERGALSLSYFESWQDSEGAHPLSLSMPLPQRDHADAIVRPFVEGLLPDNDTILREWGRRFGVSSRNPFSLLAHVGEDVAGAAQFVRPDRVEALQREEGEVQWLSDKEVGDRLRELAKDESAWRSPSDTGHFSLAGAQPKTALLREGSRWAVPSGIIATTHILKPPVLGLRGFAENEHLCLRLAQALGLSAAISTIIEFDGEQVIVVERYDRADGLRIHQEDLCQAQGVSPRAKYESEGGPGAAAIISLLRDNSSDPGEDVQRFLSALALNWFIGGPDAHAKNYSVLIAPRGQVRLAPLYDLVSLLPYPEREVSWKIKLAMKVGGESRVGFVKRRHWKRLAEATDLDPEAVVVSVTEIGSAIRDVLADVVAEEVGSGVDEEFGHVFQGAVLENVGRCLKALSEDE